MGAAATSSPPRACRRRWIVRGQVQGVGYRPFVWRLARRHNLTGAILNDSRGVVIEAQGDPRAVEAFGAELSVQRPALALVARIDAEDAPAIEGETEFRIAPSREGDRGAQVTTDVAVCQACVAEMLQTTDRRHRYGLINCTDCGPRYSIVRRVPYDRPNTTMAAFVMCGHCAAEYESPADRRFHAQPIACHDCGPRLELVDPRGRPIEADPIDGAAQRLADGRIVAIKGLGGFHLAVRADDAQAVARLRKLKQRDAKPFALMCPTMQAARRLVDLGPSGAQAMESPAAPIILARRRVGAALAPGVAPGNHRLGVMLPYTPIHHLLCSTPAIHGSSLPLVMTSGNLSDEPLAIDNAEAVERLGPLCDAMLWHDRPIQRCVDDSVLMDLGDGPPLPVRRSRGYVPMSVPLGVADDSMGLAVGGELKNTVAVVREGNAILSQHLGDLNHPLALEYFARAMADMQDLFGVRPAWIAHDLHPLYQSRLHGVRLASKLGAALIGVQHHHAHAASLMAEHGVCEPILAIVCDGVGYGQDGTSWGGELLHCDLTRFERLGHLSPLLLPGGDAAAKDTRRCGLALMRQSLGDSFADHPLATRLVPDGDERQFLCQMLGKGVNCAASSGAGRVFDGIAALLGVGTYNDFEAQSAMAIEACAASWEGPVCSDALFAVDDHLGIDLSPLYRRLIAQTLDDPGRPAALAALFHEQFALAWEAAVLRASQHTGIRTVGLSGGCFCNEILTKRLTQLLDRRGLRVLRHQVVGPNDGGIALGQAAVAMARRKAGA